MAESEGTKAYRYSCRVLWCQIPVSHAFDICSWTLERNPSARSASSYLMGGPWGWLGERFWCVQPIVEGSGLQGWQEKAEGMTVTGQQVLRKNI